MIFAAKEYDAGASLHVIKRQPSRQPTRIQGRGEAQPSHFQISNFEIVLNVCKDGRGKIHACA
jgi:hypothetical protein